MTMVESSHISLYIISGANWQTPWQLLPTLMMAFNGEAEMSVSIDSRLRLNSPANNVSNYVDTGCETLRNSITYTFLLV